MQQHRKGALYGFYVGDDAFGRKAALKAAYGNGFDLKARLSYKALLHAVLVADKQKHGSRAVIFDVARDSERGIDVTGGAAACK